MDAIHTEFWQGDLLQKRYLEDGRWEGNIEMDQRRVTYIIKNAENKRLEYFSTP